MLTNGLVSGAPCSIDSVFTRLCAVVYLTGTMTLGALSVCLTVLVLNLHHRDDERQVPAWTQTLVLDYLATVLCVTGNQLGRRGADTTERHVVPPIKVNVKVCIGYICCYCTCQFLESNHSCKQAVSVSVKVLQRVNESWVNGSWVKGSPK